MRNPRKVLNYLGCIISERGVQPDPQNLRAVKEFSRPQNGEIIKQFLCIAGYYRMFIPNFSETAKSLTNLLKKDEKFIWTAVLEEAFTQLRNLLCSGTLLQYPNFTKPFIVITDASSYAIGGIHSQGTIGKDLPVAYTSRLLSKAEQNYSIIEKELLAM
ncbi:hypothetical protein HN011_001173, partial [Eciton burchellii]